MCIRCTFARVVIALDGQEGGLRCQPEEQGLDDERVQASARREATNHPSAVEFPRQRNDHQSVTHPYQRPSERTSGRGRV